jgi:hypothetical protein
MRLAAHRGPHAAAAQDDAAVGAMLAQRDADRRGVVDGVEAVRADVEHVADLFRQKCFQALLQLEARVIRSDRNPDLNSPAPLAAWPRSRWFQV